MDEPRPLKQIAIAIVEFDGQFLVGRRPPGVPLAGLWEFPGGKVEIGQESPHDAARRECREETGLEIEITQAYPPVQHAYAHGWLELHFFHARPQTAESLPAVASPFLWVKRTELQQLEFPPANRAVLDWLV